MRALRYAGKSMLKFVEVPEPVMQKGQVLIRPAFTGICGTDLTIWHGQHPRATSPVTLGHEFSGTIVGAPEGSHLAIGDQVVVEPVATCGECPQCGSGDYNDCVAMGLIGVDLDGSLSGVVAVDINKVLPVPAGLSLRDAAFTEPLAVVVHAFRRAGLKLAGETVFISGGGPIGLLAGSVAVSEGAAVLISEPNPFRRGAAERLGLSVVDPSTADPVAALLELTDGVGSALTIEASGVSAGLNACVAACRPLATLVLIGLAKDPATLDGNTVIGRELRLLGSRIYTRVDFMGALDLLARCIIRPEDHISDVVKLDEVIVRGFERIDRGEPVLKVLVDHGAEG